MPDRPMPPALHFMLAARRMELCGLEGLAFTCELVTQISQLVHALQRERGYSNLFLGTPDQVHLGQLERLSDQALAIEQAVCARFEAMDLDTSSAVDRARLFTRIAYVLHGLQELPRLRRRIREHRIVALHATAAFTRLIGGLLAVVFEAADTAADPAITRLLVAMFNFMQGKELAGQERATGVAGFLAGYFDNGLRQRFEQLAHAQDRCFETFADFAGSHALAMWQALLAHECTGQVQRLRALASGTHSQAQVDAGLSELWFEITTQRIDMMKAIETHLEQSLLDACQRSIQAARLDLENHRRLVNRLASLDPASDTEQQPQLQPHLPPHLPPRLFNIQASDLESTLAADTLAPHLGRSVLDLLQAQTQRLAGVTDELEQARQALNDRKVVERAKKWLMDQHQLSEPQAYARLRQAAMDRGQRLVEVAHQLLAQAQPTPRA
ncbi:nitrate regulatory protein [Pseudomonas typographi]|uniref:nitrate regulatory protein n=1 Tax=Pseudomonas typographi TaxID=2715964 RepID=UPI0016864368|nr:nitrate regulatory protein [Pseudomonas typographi]MBD1550646.1 ANTAR domain-containing protein [Pseudomonas typographi]MBD1586769.1 ANTAR domain-containing protein [Pseudomonas typographi]